MKSVFESFLQSSDLDDALKLSSQIKNLESQEEQAALDILEAWSDQQAVANLLFHPKFIPTSSRERFILRGLEDWKNPYFVLAAVVGCVFLSDEKTSDETRLRIKHSLIDYCRNQSDVVGERASVSLRAFLEKKDIPILLPVFSVRNETIRDNVVGWVVQNWNGETPEKISDELKAAGLSWFQRRRALNALRNFISKRSTVPSGFRTAPLLSYIPNLKQTLR